MISGLHQKLLVDEEFRENYLKSCGTLTMNVCGSEETSEEEDLIIFAVERLQAQDFIDMCGEEQWN